MIVPLLIIAYLEGVSIMVQSAAVLKAVNAEPTLRVSGSNAIIGPAQSLLFLLALVSILRPLSLSSTLRLSKEADR
jgi:hypothetical protein